MPLRRRGRFVDVGVQGAGPRRRHRRAGRLRAGAAPADHAAPQRAAPRATGGRRSRPRAPRPACPTGTARRRSPSAASSTGWSCSTRDGEVLRPAKLWNDTESAPDADALVAELPGGAAAWAAACGSVPVASFTITKLAWLRRCEPDVFAPDRRRPPPPRLAHLPADRRAHDRPRRRVGHRLLVPAEERYRTDLLDLVDDARRLGRPRSPTCSARSRSAGEWADDRRGRRPGNRRQHGRRAGARSAARRPRAQPRHQRHRVRGQRPPERRPDRHRRRLRRRHGTLPAPRVHAERHEGDRRRRAPARRRHRPAWTRSRSTAPPGAGGLVLVPHLDGERTPNRPTPPARSPACAPTRPASSSPGPRSRAWSPTSSTGADELAAADAGSRRAACS